MTSINFKQTIVDSLPEFCFFYLNPNSFSILNVLDGFDVPPVHWRDPSGVLFYLDKISPWTREGLGWHPKVECYSAFAEPLFEYLPTFTIDFSQM